MDTISSSGRACARDRPSLLVALVSALALLGSIRPAQAHSEGAVSVDRFLVVEVGAERIRLRVIADFGELPSRRELERMREGKEAYASSALRELAAGLSLTVDGQALPLAVDDAFAVQRPGDGTLPTVLVYGALAAALPHGREPLRLALRDGAVRTGPGWRELRVHALDGRALSWVKPAEAALGADEPFPPMELRGKVRDDRGFEARLTAAGGTSAALPSATAPSTNAPGGVAGGARPRLPDPLVKLLGAPHGPAGLLLALLAALVLGAAHALAPGHGKGVIAATLASTRGSLLQALVLGLSAAATHVFGVALLAVAALGAFQLSGPEHLFPWLTRVAGVVVAANGAVILWQIRAAALRSRARREELRRRDEQQRHDLPILGLAAEPEHAHEHVHEHDHDHEHAHEHPHHHWHASQPDLALAPSFSRLLLLGVGGGLLPCPSSLVVLLAAVALQRMALGIVLVLAFALGIASTLTAVGLLAVRTGSELQHRPRLRLIARWLPLVSGVAMLAMGLGVALSTW